MDNKRTAWIDLAKGIGIISVVFCHSLGTLSHSKGFEFNVFFYNFLDTFVEGFQMPLFFFVSGFFVYNSIERYSGKKFLSVKLRTIIYPYIIWSFLQINVKYFLSSYSNEQITLIPTLIQIFYLPFMQFWFLYTLFLIFIIVFLLKGLNKIFFFIISIASYIIFEFIFNINIIPFECSILIYHLQRVLHYLPFFLAGALLFSWIVRLRPTKLLVASCFVLFCLYIFTVLIFMNKQEIEFFKTNLLISTIGIALVITASKLMELSNKFNFLKNIGEQSLLIYVAHFMFLIASKVILVKVFHTYNIYYHLITNTFIAIAFPLLLHKLCNKIGFRYLIHI